MSVHEPDEATIREAFNLMECRDSWSGSWCSQRREAGLAALDRLVADRDTATERYAVVRHAYAIEAQARGAAEAEVAVLTARLTEAAEQKDKAFAAMTHWLGKANWAEAQVRELTEALTELHDWAKRCAGFHIAPETARARAALDAAEPGKEAGQ